MKILKINRFEIISLLSGNALRGIELGVAKGGFSKHMVESGRFQEFYGVDAYCDAHDTQEYLTALTTVGITQNYKLLRMFFSDALALFPDGYFDFIYIDGYAHTGEMGGETMFQWLEKLKLGGVIAGDDYDSEKWPFVVEAVDHFASVVGGELKITSPDLINSRSIYDKYPSWVLSDQGLKRGFSADPDMAVNGARLFRNKAVAQQAKLKNPVVAIPPAKFASTTAGSSSNLSNQKPVSAPAGWPPKGSKPAKELCNKGKAKILVIVANGPTHKEADLAKLKGHNTIDLMTINKPDDRIWPTDYWLFCDPALQSRHDQYWQNYTGITINTRQVAEVKSNNVKLQTIAERSFSSDLEAGVHIGRTSTYVGLQVAMYMNYAKVFVFGCDMSRVNGLLYPWGENPDARSDLREQRFAKEALSFQHFADNSTAEQRNKIVFCSLENPWPFVQQFNTMDHREAVDNILRAASI